MNAQQRRKDFRRCKIEQIFGAFCRDDDDDDIVRVDLEGFGIDVEKSKKDFTAFLDELTKRAAGETREE